MSESSKNVIINVAMGIVTLALLGYIVLNFLNIETLMASERWDNNAQAALAEIEQTLSLLKDAETGQRGFLLTGEEDHLEPYRTAVPLIEEHLDRLETLASQSPSQQARIAVLRRLISEKMETLQQGLEVRRKEGLQGALRIIRTGQEKQVMDEARLVMAGMEREEERRLTLLYRIRYCFSAFSLAMILLAVLVLRFRLARFRELEHQD